MTVLKSYQDLEVWRKSIDLAEKVYLVSQNFPQEERYGLTSQLRRAVISIATNIAEGAARTGTREFLQFLSTSSGSLAETETFLILAHRLKMLPEQDLQTLMADTMTISKMIGGLKRSLRSKL